MGNTQSIQRESSGTGSDEQFNGYFINPQVKGVLVENEGRQDSITSQLFPNRKTRHGPSSLGNIKRRTGGNIPQSPSIFKKNYSLREAGAGAQGPDGANKVNTLSESKGRHRDSNETNTSTENVRGGMAELSIKSCSGIVPGIFSPGPATPTVQPTKEEAVPPLDDNIEFHNRRSVVALKKNLQESEQASCRSRSSSSANAAAGGDSIDIEKLGRLPELPLVVTNTASAMTINCPSVKIGHSSSDTDPESPDIDNISDNGYLQSRDIVLNQSLLHNVIKRDMKRKRDNNNNDTSTLNAIEKNGEKTDTFPKALQSEDVTLETTNDVHNSNLHDAKDRLKSGSSFAPNTVSYDSMKSGHLQDIKNLKPVGYKTLLHPNPADKNFPNVLEQHRKNSYSIDSFEKGSIEHREVEGNDRHSFFSTSSSPVSSSSFEQSRTSENVHVAIKWRDELPDGGASKMNMISEDIASTLRLENPKCRTSNIFPMVHDASSQEWVVPDLALPAGIYRLQFLINGELRHSNYLPTATDSVGNFVNWFEVIPGFEEVEPYRDEVEIDSKWPLSNEDRAISDSALSDRSQGSRGMVPEKTGGRPPLGSLRRSSNRVQKSNTPYSDFTGVSRSSSVLRKSKSPINHTASSLDLRTALQPKKYKYTNEIPELFKTTPISPPNDNDLGPRHVDPLVCDWYSQVSIPGLGNKVVDCNQDTLFTELQQGGLLNAEMAERSFLDKYPVPDLPVYLNSFYLNKILSEFQKNNYSSNEVGSINHIIPHVNLNHLLTSSIRDEMISVGCTTRYEGKFITQVIYAPCYYENGRSAH